MPIPDNCCVCGKNLRAEPVVDVTGIPVVDNDLSRIWCDPCYEKAHPVRWYRRAWWAACCPARGSWQWLKYRLHPGHRYHVVRTGLPPGWHDRDLVMASTIVRIFLDFIEKEKPYEWFDTAESNHREEWERVRALYEFFKGADVAAMDSEDPDALTEKLVEVVRLRTMFWT